MRDRSRTLAVSAGGVAAAFLGSLCCVGPLAFAVLGVGAGLGSRLEPLRPVFGALMLGAFAIGFQRAYGRPAGAPAAAMAGGAECGVSDAAGPRGVACDVPTHRRRDRALLWVAAMVALALWTFPSWSTVFV